MHSSFLRRGISTAPDFRRIPSALLRRLQIISLSIPNYNMDPVIEFSGIQGGRGPPNRAPGDRGQSAAAKRGRGSAGGQRRPQSAAQSVEAGAAAFAVSAALAASRMGGGSGSQEPAGWQQQQERSGGPPQGGRGGGGGGGGSEQRPAKRSNGMDAGNGRPASARPDQSQRQGGGGQQQHGARPQSALPSGNGSFQQQQVRHQHQAAVAPPADQQAGEGVPAKYVSKPINVTALQHQSNVRFEELAISPITKR